MLIMPEMDFGIAISAQERVVMGIDFPVAVICNGGIVMKSVCVFRMQNLMCRIVKCFFKG